MTKVPVKKPRRSGADVLLLLEQVPEAERDLPVHLIVGGLPRVPGPAHALLHVPGYEYLLRCRHINQDSNTDSTSMRSPRLTKKSDT